MLFLMIETKTKTRKIKHTKYFYQTENKIDYIFMAIIGKVVLPSFIDEINLQIMYNEVVRHN